MKTGVPQDAANASTRREVDVIDETAKTSVLCGTCAGHKTTTDQPLSVGLELLLLLHPSRGEKTLPTRSDSSLRATIKILEPDSNHFNSDLMPSFLSCGSQSLFSA